MFMRLHHSSRFYPTKLLSGEGQRNRGPLGCIGCGGGGLEMSANRWYFQYTT